jgi:hypothetical protein
MGELKPRDCLRFWFFEQAYKNLHTYLAILLFFTLLYNMGPLKHFVYENGVLFHFLSSDVYSL